MVCGSFANKSYPGYGLEYDDGYHMQVRERKSAAAESAQSAVIAATSSKITMISYSHKNLDGILAITRECMVSVNVEIELGESGNAGHGVFLFEGIAYPQ